MTHLYTYVALDIARERAREAELDHRARLATRDHVARPGFVRRGLANGLAIVSRGTASAARRLDAVAAEDLTTAVATAK